MAESLPRDNRQGCGFALCEAPAARTEHHRVLLALVQTFSFNWSQHRASENHKTTWTLTVGIDGWERKEPAKIHDFQLVDANLIKRDRKKLDPGQLTEADVTSAFRKSELSL